MSKAVSVMTRREAQEKTDLIKESLSSARSVLLEMHERKGWRVLGYKSWLEYGKVEFGYAQTHIYRLMSAAKVERNISATMENSPIGEFSQAISESQARPLTQLSPDVQGKVWQDAVESSSDGEPTAIDVTDAVARYKEEKKQKEPVKKTMNRTNDNIEWASFSWNPVTGCLHNCDYCYARDIANRFYQQGFEPTYYPERLPMPGNTKQISPRWDGDIGYQNVFVCSMADLFGKWVPEEWIQSVIAIAVANPQWNFLFLTKFPIRMAEFNYPSNVWLGTTVDKQHAVDRAEIAFNKIKASGFDGVCWLSCEPMLERLTFNNLEVFDWVVIGGASKSSQTQKYYPPFDDIVYLYNQARISGCHIYMKTNLLGERVQEYPV